VAITLERAVKWNPPHNLTLPRLDRVTGPTCFVVFLQFVQNLDCVFASGLIIEQEYSVFVIEVIRVTDGEPVGRQRSDETMSRTRNVSGLSRGWGGRSDRREGRRQRIIRRLLIASTGAVSGRELMFAIFPRGPGQNGDGHVFVGPPDVGLSRYCPQGQGR
jgi:hypothetical protein